MIDPMQEVRDRLILAALPNVPFDGWSGKLLKDAAVGLGLDSSMGERAFPGGPVEAVLHFADLADRRLAEQASGVDLSRMGMTARVTWLVRRRIEEWTEHREAVRRAVSLLSLPNHVGQAARATWRTADLIWYLAGDHSVDFSYYTKRATLSAVYSTTLFTWLSDVSDESAASWAFLDRRVGDLAKLPKAMKALRRRVGVFGNPAEMLSAALSRHGEGRHFGVKRRRRA
jgi:ubiquinone biosynthesis protein COQ9